MGSLETIAVISEAPVPLAAEAQSVVKSAAPARRHIPEIDGLRGLSAIGVVLFHYLRESRKASPAIGWITNGLLLNPGSVDMFFILSGFLIGMILLRSRESPNYYKTFYVRRFYRIMPLYYAWTIPFFLFFFFTAAGWGMEHPAGYSSFAVVGIYLGMLQNNFIPVMDASVWLVATWTLGVEEPFYMVIPFCFRLSSKAKMACVFGGTILFSLLFRAFVYGVLAKGAEWGSEAADHWTLSRISVPAWGCLFALAWATPNIKAWIEKHVVLFYLGMPCFIALNVLLDHLTGTSLPHAFTLFILFGREALVLSALCLVVAVVAHPKGHLAGVMRWKILQRFGMLSYGVYLMHYGIFWFTYRFILHRQPDPHTWLAVELTPVCFLAVWGLAELSWKYFEAPLVRRSQSYTY